MTQRLSSPAVQTAVSQARMAVLAASAISALWLVTTHAHAQTADASAAVPAVNVMSVGGQDVGAAFSIDGALQAVQQTVVSAQASGRVTELKVKAGDKVKTGQLLATIDDRTTRAGMAQATAGVAQAQANYANAKASHDRTKELKSQGFVAQAALDSAVAQLRAAEAGLQAARAGQTQSGLAQGFTQVTAPYDGWVLQTHIEAGTLAMPGTPLVTVYAPEPMRAVVHVPASQQAAAESATRIEVKLPGAEAKWVKPASVSSVPAADPVSQTLEWRLNLAADDATGQVPGRQVQVRFIGGPAKRMVVPAAAVVHRGELTAVYAVVQRGDQKAFALRTVRLGAEHDGEMVEVLAGLKAGDEVALDPVRAGLSGAKPAGRN
ncbi:efflux RND transporter periplasmic adaptor subunit [Hydrogenophaga sp. 5NK40-0174]|uniref:efflux RND transporter periplasmic adaptor subunit n=1 Tax=Hydrogenophaga sp. 5NK40-0174 TaxID=3127649 RepID=UPI003101F3C6